MSRIFKIVYEDINISEMVVVLFNFISYKVMIEMLRTPKELY